MSCRRIGLFFCLIVAAAIAISAGCLSASPTDPIESTAAPKHITLTWTGNPATSQTITWQTDEPVDGQVRLALKEQAALSRPAKLLHAEMKAVPTNRGTRYVHSINLTKLKPGSSYAYQVGGGSTWSELLSFRTAPAAPGQFTFLVFGDSQSINYQTWQSVLRQAYHAHPDAAFITCVGDLVDVGQDYAQWDAWFSAGKGIIDSVPVMPLTGNHESYSPERRFSPPVLFTSQFSLPQNGPDGLKEQAYSFDYGQVHFVVLDTQAGEQREFLPDLLQRQTRWLEKDLKQANKPWTIVFMHRPPYDNKSFRDNPAVREAFTPLFDRYQVDLVFTGHDHVYARTYPLRGGAPAPRGTVYVAAGRSGSKTYSTVSANPLNEVFYNPQAEPNYLTVSVQAERISIRALTQSGLVIDAWTLEKAKGKEKGKTAAGW